MKISLSESEVPVNKEDLRLALLEANGAATEEEDIPTHKELSRVKFMDVAETGKCLLLGWLRDYPDTHCK